MLQTQVGTPERRSKYRWWVPSGQVGYTVERIGWHWRGTCPSHRFRRETLCKHIIAVIRSLREGR